MNQKNVFRSIGIAAILCLCATQIFAQFNVDGWLIDRWGETTTTFGQNIKAITIGNFSAAFRPRAALHISANILTPPTNPATMFLPGELFRTDGPGNRINAWRLWTGLQPGQPPDGSPLSEKGMIFNYGNNPVVADQTNFSLQASVWDMTFHTLPITANTVGTERVRIVGVQRIFTPGPPLQPTIIKAGNVGIGCPNPLTMLHIGDFSGLGSGYRTWMDIGTFYNYSYGFDNMYVGLKVLGNDMSEAIINWGNNPVPGDLGDRLRFVFTAATSLGLPASDASGLEAGRVISNGSWVRWGIGDFETPAENPLNTMDVQGNAVIGSPYAGNINTSAPLNGMLVHGFTGMGMVFTNALVPKRRLDVAEEKDGPQFRLTQKLNANVNDGIFTDFDTDENGNLMIRPFSYLTPMSVGINHPSLTPLLTELDVNGNGCFRNMPVAPPNNFDGVLIDAYGVLWRGPAGGTGTGFGAECGSSTPFDLTSNWRVGFGIANNNFYFAGQGITSPLKSNSVGIGWDCVDLSAKLDVLQFSGSTATIGINVLNKDFIQEISQRSVGIKAKVEREGAIAGWFEVTQITPSAQSQAIYVPNKGGNVCIGYPISQTPFSPSSTLLFLNGDAEFLSNTYPSDALLKQDTIAFASGLDVVRKIKVMSYRYNGLAGLPTNRTYFGLIAEQLCAIAPYAVDTSLRNLYPTDTTPTPILRVKSEAIFYTAINAIKQLDSTISAPPAAPILISPADSAVVDGRTVIFTWHSVSQGITLYRTQIAKDNSFSNIVSDYPGITDTTFYTGFCDSIPTTYYWRINAKNNAGTGAWSQVFSFTDTAICKKRVAEPISPVTAVGFNSTSDSLLKINIVPLTNALYKVLQLNGVYYDWLHTNSYYDFDSTRQIGFKAQDVQSVVPEVVHTDTNGFLTLDYGRLVPVLAEAIKEQQDTINNLKNIISSYESRFSTIENMLAQCCEQTKSAQTDVNATIQITTDPTLSKQTLLYQNRPNPFNVTTTFAYTLGEGGNVELIIEDSYGRLITTLVNQKQIPGDYSIDWNAENITSGIYFYSLKVNGILLVKKAIKY